MKKVLTIGHRGCRESHATENTISAFKCAIDNKLDGLEMDLRVTKDGHIVVHHDSTLKRIYDSDLAVANSTLAELKKATSEHPNPIISLKEALDFIGNFPCFLEIKSDGVAEILDSNIDYSKTKILGVISFQAKHLKAYRSSGGKSVIGFLPNKKNFVFSPFVCKLIGAELIALGVQSRHTPFFVHFASFLGLKTYFYPINSVEMGNLFVNKFSASYLCGDSPELLNRLKH